jgi:outer membrane protein TolC
MRVSNLAQLLWVCLSPASDVAADVAGAAAAVRPATGFSTEPPLTLEEALALSSKSHEAPRIALARVAQAHAQASEARALLLPRLTAAGSYTRRRQEVTRELAGQSVVLQKANALNGSLSLQAGLFDATALPVLERAKHLVAERERSAEEVRRDLAFDVCEAYFAVLSAEKLRDASLRREKLSSDSVDDARARLDAGLSARHDVTRAELELASAVLSRVKAQSAVVAAREGLGFLVGTAVSRPVEEPAATPRTGGDDLPVLEQEALAARLDLKALEERAAAARAAANEPRYRLLPTLALTGTVRATNEAGFTGQSADWNLGTTLSWVLFDGGVRYAQAAVRAAELEEAGLQLGLARRRVGLELRAALSSLAAAAESRGQAEGRLRLARRNGEEVRERFRDGIATALERADASVSEFEAEAEVARQGFAVRLAQLALVRALGKWPLESMP